MPGISVSRIPVPFNKGGGISWSSYWKKQSLFFLDGSVKTVGESKYFADTSTNGRDFLITDYDFNVSVGFPYKSKATISAPAGDAALIAADIHNFLYDSGGTPNAIPVVSLFQDIDYAHKIFCQHSPQVLNGSNVVTFEPRVLSIYMATDVLTGADLTKAQTEFGVPTEVTSNVWWVDPVNGNDTTGNGTKALPHKTLDHTQTHAANGHTIYFMTGRTTEWMFIYKELTVIGIGRCDVAPTSQNPFHLAANNVTVRGFIVTPNTNSNGIYSAIKGSNTFERVYVKKFSSYSVWLRGEDARKLILKDSVIDGKILYSTSDVDIVGCLVLGVGKDNILMQSPAENTNTLTVKYNRLRIPINSVGDASYVINNGSNNLIVFNNEITVVNAFALFKHLVSNIANIEVEYNTHTGAASTAFLDLQVNKCNYNRITFTGTNVPIKIPTITIPTMEIKGNVIDNGALQCIEISGVNTGLETLTIDGNTLITRTVPDNGYFGGIVIGTAADTTERTYTAIIKNNRLIGPKAVGQAVGCHSLIYAGNMKNLQVSHNYFEGAGLYSMVVKSSIEAFECTSGYIFGNLFNELGVCIKGVGNCPVYGNTLSTTDGARTLVVTYEEEGSICANMKLKNNIVYTEAATGTLIVATDIDENFDSDYNVLYPLGQTPSFTYSGVGTQTLAQWQALGFDTHSVVVNPNLTNLIPAVAISGGEDLGETFEDGLDITTDWGSLTEAPTVVTKKQSASWQIGAYVQ